MSLRIDSLGPIHGGERRGQQTLAIRPVQHEEVAVARCLHQQLAWLAVEIGIRQHGDFVCIPIVRVVRRSLKSPDQFPGIRVERDNAARPGIISRPYVAIQHGRGISRAHEDQIEVGIVRAGGPHLAAGGAAALRFLRAGRRRAVKNPLRLAGICIDGFQLARQIIEIARDADQHVIPHNQRSVGRPVTFVGIGDHDVPLDLAVLRIQRDQVTVRSGQIHRVLINGRAAMADVERVIGRILVVPKLLARARVDGPDVVRRGHVKDAVRQNRRGFDLILPRLKAPNLLELADVIRRDFSEAGMTPAGVVAMEGEPTVHPLRGRHCRETKSKTEPITEQ